MSRIALVGGGTGGHVFPALAVAHELQQGWPDSQAWLATGRKPIEQEWTRDVQPPPKRLHSAPMPYGLRPAGVARALGAAALGTVEALLWWLKWRPDVMLTFGGYTSVPAVLAARVLACPYVCHAADAKPDRAARKLGGRARLVTVNYPESAEAFAGVRVEVIGQPVRPWLFSASRQEAAQALGLSPQRTTLVVMGGSQGARRLNQAAVGAAPKLLDHDELQVLHMTGRLDYEEVTRRLEGQGVPEERYRAMAFLPQVEWALALADLALTRCGANSLAELAVAGAAMILVPYPHAGGHQRYNALPLQEAGAGIIVEDEEMTPDRLAQEVGALMGDEPRRRAMGEAARAWARPDAARRLAEILMRIAGE